MILRLLCQIVFGGVTTAAVAAQTDRQWTELVMALKDANRRDWSIQQMDGFGAEAPRRLIQHASTGRDPVVLRVLFHAISELAHHCGSEGLQSLVRLEPRVSNEVLPDLLDVQLTVAPFLCGFDANIKRIEGLAWQACVDREGEVSNRYWEVNRRASQLEFIHRNVKDHARRYPPLHPDMSTAALIDELNPCCPNTLAPGKARTRRMR